VNLRNGIATWRPRTLIASSAVVDARGHGLASLTKPIQATADQGFSVNGRVLGATGQPLAGIPVTLTMDDLGPDCGVNHIRVSQVFTDASGGFTYDFVTLGIRYTLGATDIRGLSTGAATLLLDSATQGTPDPMEIESLAAAPGGAAQVLAA